MDNQKEGLEDTKWIIRKRRVRRYKMDNQKEELKITKWIIRKKS
jgi:hypothetical protein